MLPTVFLSLEGDDASFVGRLQRFLPDGLAYFYPCSFQNGEQLISAMESRIDKISMFILFASKTSVSSPWVGFEIDRVRIQKIKNPNLRIIVVIIDKEINYKDLPSWMHEYWIGNIGNGPREIARYIRRSLVTGPLGALSGNQVYGRGKLIDSTVTEISNTVLRTEKTPNILVISGNTGIGRRTFTRKLLGEAFPATPELSFGPEFILPQFADLADLYRALRQEIETDLVFSEEAKDIKEFSEATIEQQAQEVTQRLLYFAELGQAVTVVTGNGIYEDKGYLKSWAPELFNQINLNQKIKLILITNRLLHQNELMRHPNLLQFQVTALKDPDIRSLMIGSCVALGVKPELPSNEVISIIGGHPGIARATAALVARKGPMVVNSDQSDIFTLQEKILGESLNFGNLNEIEKDILSVLSWVAQLAGDTLKRIVLKRYDIKDDKLAQVLSGLILSCIVEVSGSNYLITSPVRSFFRRLRGYGSRELMSAFSETLREEWEIAKNNNELRAELLDALVYMAAIEGGTLLPEFRDLLLPSTLQEVVHNAYDRGHDDPEAFNRVVSLGLPAMKLHMDETTREEILSYVVRAQVRLKDEAGVQETLQFIDSRSYRSRFYLRSFYLRIYKLDMKGSIQQLLKAREVKKYMKQVIADLGRCYQRLGMWSDLYKLVQDEEQYIGRNPVLLDVKIGMLIAKADFETAEKLIRVLHSLERQEVYAGGREAMMMMRRDQNFKGAQELLTNLLQRGLGAHTFLRRLRAIAAASSGDVRTAREDADFLKGRGDIHGIHRIEARIKLANKDFSGAEVELRKGGSISPQDELLRARILEEKSEDHSTSFSDRNKLRNEVAKIRARNRMLTEYEVER